MQDSFGAKKEGKLLKNFVKEIKKNKNVKSVLQVGSSLLTKKSGDIDLIIVVKGSSPSFEDMKFLSLIEKKFSEKYGASFGFGGVPKQTKSLHIDITLIPENWKLFYSFRPLLIYGFSLNPSRILYGYDFFKKIKNVLKPDNEMLLKSGPFDKFYRYFILNFKDLKPERSKYILSELKFIVYPLSLIKGRHVEKNNLMKSIRVSYPFFDRLCKKYKIRDDIFYQQRLSKQEIEKIYSFARELILEIYKNLFT